MVIKKLWNNWRWLGDEVNYVARYGRTRAPDAIDANDADYVNAVIREFEEQEEQVGDSSPSRTSEILKQKLADLGATPVANLLRAYGARRIKHRASETTAPDRVPRE